MVLPAKINRHALRIAAVQALFQLDAQGDDFRQQIDSFLADQEIPAESLPFARQLVDQTWQHHEPIDALISQTSQHWDLRRIAPIDRAILRLAIGELMYQQDTPPKVVMNEAIEIAKEYGSEESPQFVNGLLDAIYKKLKMENSSPRRHGEHGEENKI